MKLIKPTLAEYDVYAWENLPLPERARQVCLAVSKVMGFRLMHLQGRALAELLPKTVDDLAAYDYYDGEITSGLVLGWNFGDGHLNNERLLRIVQERCGFEEGELCVLCVEGQPLLKHTMAYRIYDAQRGLMTEGKVDVDAMREPQPWEASP